MAISATIGSASSSTGGMPSQLAFRKWRLPMMLALAFGGVIYMQYGHVFESEAGAAPRADAAVTDAENVESAKNLRSIGLPNSLALPTIQLSEALQFDPFAPTPLLSSESPVEIVSGPLSSSRPQVDAVDIEANSALMQKLKSTPIQLIYSDSQGRKVALIGGKAIHVGDSFQGMTILDITPNGLIVETTE